MPIVWQERGLHYHKATEIAQSNWRLVELRHVASWPVRELFFNCIIYIYIYVHIPVVSLVAPISIFALMIDGWIRNLIPSIIYYHPIDADIHLVFMIRTEITWSIRQNIWSLQTRSINLGWYDFGSYWNKAIIFLGRVITSCYLSKFKSPNFNMKFLCLGPPEFSRIKPKFFKK